MSLLDKINDSLSEPKNIKKKYSPNDIDLTADNIKTPDDSNLKIEEENVLLKAQLDNSKIINDKNIKEIEELKLLIKNYDSKLDNLKKSYDERINNLNNQLNFEKEINTSYLNKLVNVNSDLSEDVRVLKDNSTKSNEEISSLINDIKSDNSTSNDKLYEMLVDENKEVNNNFKLLADIISQNRENHNSTYNNIMEELTNLNNKSSTDNADDLNKLNTLIESNHTDLLNKINLSEANLTKIEIFNSISQDIINNDFENILAYAKIKEFKLFDESFYRENYDYNLDIDPLLHYLYKGYLENKSPSKIFNPSVYKNSDDKINSSNMNPLVNFVNYGINEGNIRINEDIDEINHLSKSDVDTLLENFDVRGVKKTKRKPRLIVSLTTLPKHIDSIQYTLYSLLNQELKADKVILWLNAKDYPNGEIDLPKAVLKLKNNGLSIRFTDNYNYYNKIIPGLISYPKDIHITANDNIYYPRDWLKQLYDEYKKDEHVIITFNAKSISTDENNNIQSYDKWVNNEVETTSYLNYPNLYTGVLYPQNTFSENVTNQDLFSSLSDGCVELWLWSMAVLNNIKIKNIINKFDDLIYVNPIRQVHILDEYYDNIEQANDMNIMINNLVDKYPEILEIIKDE